MAITRKDFLRNTGLATAGLFVGGSILTKQSYGNIIGANDKIKVGIIGFSSRAQGALIPSFMKIANNINIEITCVSDIWKQRREQAVEYFQKKYGKKITVYRNNEELYEKADVDAVIISTADFQHAFHCVEAIKAGKDVYVEKPLANRMVDACEVFDAVEASENIVQMGTQRRSGRNYHAANDYIRSGKFGKIAAVEMTWNVNQPGRWRRPAEVAALKKSDVDWKRFLINRPNDKWDPRKFLEYRLFWPYSSGIPGQWMTHQIDTVHWFTGYDYPRSVSANGGIYMWNDGRENFDTMTAVFDYGDPENMNNGFQVIYSSRQTNSAGGTKELYFSNGGELNLATNKVTPNGGLNKRYAKAMNMKPFLLPEFKLADNIKVATAANTGADDTTTAHMRNWLECVRDRKKPNADIKAGFNHAVANIMTVAALQTGMKTTYDPVKREVFAGGEPFK